MRLVRIAALAALILAIVIGGSAALIAFNQSRIVVYVLASVHNRTGVEIIPRSSSVHLGTHLIVDLDHPQVLSDGHEIVKLKSLRAVISYHSIFTSTGLPLFRLTATSPQIILPVASTNAAAISMPRPGTPTIDAMQDALHALLADLLARRGNRRNRLLCRRRRARHSRRNGCLPHPARAVQMAARV